MRAIDADELKKCVLKWLPEDPCGRQEKEMPFETDICVSMLMEIEEQPTIQLEQRTGYWYPVGMVEAVGGESAQWGSAIAYHKCSECDEQALRDDFEQEVLSKWCPHCGAKMRGTLWE